MEPLPNFGNPEPEDPAGTATLVPEKKRAAKRKRRRIPRYHVILWDSDLHSYAYVERMLHELFGHTKEQCHQMAVTVEPSSCPSAPTTTPVLVSDPLVA